MKTKLDLHLAASAVAQQTMNAADFAADSATLEAFNAGEFDPANWDFFKGVATDQRGAYRKLAATPALVTPPAPATPAAKPAS